MRVCLRAARRLGPIGFQGWGSFDLNMFDYGGVGWSWFCFVLFDLDGPVMAHCFASDDGID